MERTPSSDHELKMKYNSKKNMCDNYKRINLRYMKELGPTLKQVMLRFMFHLNQNCLARQLHSG